MNKTRIESDYKRLIKLGRSKANEMIAASEKRVKQLDRLEKRGKSSDVLRQEKAALVTSITKLEMLYVDSSILESVERNIITDEYAKNLAKFLSDQVAGRSEQEFLSLILDHNSNVETSMQNLVAERTGKQ